MRLKQIFNSYPVLTILFALIYAAIGIPSLHFSSLNHNASPFWPASGFGLAILLIFGKKHFLSIFLGAFLTNLSTKIPITSIFLIAFGNALEAVLGSFIFESTQKIKEKQLSKKAIGFLLAGFIAPFVSATLGNIAVSLISESESFNGMSWLTWWMGDVVGILFISPIIYELNNHISKSGFFNLLERLKSPSKSYLIFYLLGILITIGSFKYNQLFSLFFLNSILIFIVVSKFNTLMGWFYSLSIYGLSTYLASVGNSPFIGISFNAQLLLIQTILSLLALTTIFSEYVYKRSMNYLSAKIYFLGWVLIGVLFHFLISDKNDDFIKSIKNVETEFLIKLEEHENLLNIALYAGGSFFHVSKEIEASEWKNYTNSLDLKKHFPTVNGIGVIQSIKTEEITQFENSLIHSYHPQFKVHPLPGKSLNLSKGSEHFIIKFIEPLDKNLPALGIDLGTEDHRLEGLKLSRATKKSIATKPIIIVQDEEKLPSFLIFKYIESSKLNKEYWVYSPVKFRDFFNKVVSSFNNTLDLKVIDPSSSSLIYNSAPDKKFSHLSSNSVSIPHHFFNLPIQMTISLPSKQYDSSIFYAVFFIFILGVFLIFSNRFLSQVEDFSHKTELDVLNRTRDLNEALQKKSVIIKSARFLIITTDQNGIITSFNEEAERVLGYQKSELIGQVKLEILHLENELESFKNQVKKEYGIEFYDSSDTFFFKASRGDFEEKRWSLKKKNGNHVPVLLSLTALRDDHNYITGYMEIAKDISEDIRTEKILEDQRALILSSAKMASLGEMAAGIAHEINNPLGVVVGKANLLLMQMNQNQTIQPEKLKDSLEKIVKNSFRASKIIQSLKALSRNSDGDPLTLSSLEGPLTDTIDLCKEKFQMGGVEFIYNQALEQAKNISIMCRSSAISQILTNLLHNSFDAVKTKDKSWIRIELELAPEKILIKIIDSGSGIPKEIQERLMQPFFTTKEIGKGTGLGLSISKRIAQDHGGNLYLNDSHINTCFILELPIPNQNVRSA